jgi:hypothetical protein
VVKTFHDEFSQLLHNLFIPASHRLIKLSTSAMVI